MRVDYDEALARNRFDLLHEGGELVALIETLAERGQFLIVNVAVAPAHQKRGLGRRLLAHAETLAGEAGYREIRLYTYSLMTENIALYERLGYRIDRQEPVGTSVQVHMSKRLAPPDQTPR